MKSLTNDPPFYPNPSLPSNPPPFLPQPPDRPFPITCPSCSISRSQALRSTIKEKEQLQNVK